KLTRTTYQFSRRVKNDFIVLNAVQAIVSSAIADRESDLTPAYDTLSELQEEGEYIVGDIKLIYSLKDEGAKININMVNSSVLKNLPSMDMDKAIAITSSKYRPFYPKEQILVLDDIEEEDYEEIKDLITVYGNGRININTCSEEMMGYLELDDTLISRIIEFRMGEDGEMYTPDDGVFESDAAIAGALKEKIYLTEREQQELNMMAGQRLFSVRSDVYRIESEAYSAGKSVRKHSVLIGRGKGGGGYRILEWNEI
ncbi:MAG: general secretion pathway protein GspK, partial [Candidatus Omnitrophica bacterium]|nr:general secretion pathway protein GspK [Candidatus Omnitrophota bacterium]